MTPIQTIAVAVRLFAICVVIFLIRAAPGYFSAAAQYDASGAALLTIAVSAGGLLIAIVLWFFPLRVARGLLPAAKEVPVEPSSADTWFAVGSGLLGLWVMSVALPALARNLFLHFLMQRTGSLQIGDIWEGTLYYLFQVVFGVWLLLGAKGAKTIIWWARDAGNR